MDINGPRRTGHHPQLRYTSALSPTKWEQAEPIPTKKKKKEKLEMASGEVGKDLKNDYWPMVNINSSDAYKRQPWMCEVCEQQPAVFTCKADAAVLCLSCDSEVHSTNTLASRHQRVPITESIFACSTTTNHNSGNSNSTNFLFKWSDDDESEERVEGFPLWQPPAQSNKLKEGPMVTMTDVVEHNDLSSTNLFSDVEKFLDLDYAPSSSTFLGFQHGNQHQHQNQQSRLFPVNNNVVSKSHGMIVVPEEKKAKEEIHETETAAMVPVVAVGVDREARVMRYREKRKNRKFEKTIRYASRKAYAESRPRVKGRFIKREDNNDDDDTTVMVVGGGNVYSSSSSSARSISSSGNMLALDSGYGMVPSF